MIEYGKAPVSLGEFITPCHEAMNYLYMPIKLAGEVCLTYGPRLHRYSYLLDKVVEDAVATLGRLEVIDHYIYITAKTLFASPNNPGNREGWHVDGYGSDGDLNYIWSDANPTEFVIQDFKDVPEDDRLSMEAMTEQARPECIMTMPDCSILRLDEGVVHRVGPVKRVGFREFVKVSISKHKFCKAGNTINHKLDYSWVMYPRGPERNLDTNLSKE